MSLSLYRNRVTDISALASCGKLENVWLPENSITDISALASCKRVRYLDVGVNRVTDISVLAHFRKLWGVFACRTTRSPTFPCSRAAHDLRS